LVFNFSQPHLAGTIVLDLQSHSFSSGNNFWTIFGFCQGSWHGFLPSQGASFTGTSSVVSSLAGASSLTGSGNSSIIVAFVQQPHFSSPQHPHVGAQRSFFSTSPTMGVCCGASAGKVTTMVGVTHLSPVHAAATCPSRIVKAKNLNVITGRLG